MNIFRPADTHIFSLNLKKIYLSMLAMSRRDTALYFLIPLQSVFSPGVHLQTASQGADIVVSSRTPIYISARY